MPKITGPTTRGVGAVSSDPKPAKTDAPSTAATSNGWVARGTNARRGDGAATVNLRGDAPRTAATTGVTAINGTSEAANAPSVGMRLKNPNGELGNLGPLGPNGALGTSGPVGNSDSNPSHWITGSVGWDSWASLMNAWGGPLSSLGPLGENGPLNKATAASTVASLKIGGDEAALGPSGPLGALGPLGPLGPVGAHGYKADANGVFHDSSGKVMRNIKVDWNLDRSNTEELVEDYTEAQAKKMKDNDTSFMVDGKIGAKGESDDFHFTSRTNQYVTVLVLPTEGQAHGARSTGNSATDLGKQLDDFQLSITDDSGKQIGASRLQDGPNWVQLKVPKGAQLNAHVTLNGDAHGAAPYRLVVVGTGDHTADMGPKASWDTGATSIAQPK